MSLRLKLRALAAAALLALAAPLPLARAAGFQYATAPDPDDQPIDLAIWYPSDAPVAPQPLGPFTQDVAFYGPVAGRKSPLIVISHGTGGSAAAHYDTALALADAGFAVVAPTHTGDNYKDHAYAFKPRNFLGRPHQVQRALDFMLSAWSGRDSIDPSRIGMLGHSAGGTTALIVLGGELDPALLKAFCRDHADEWGCRRSQEVSTGPGNGWSEAAPPQWVHDPRIKAAVIAAPAIGHGFTKTSLGAIAVPIQLWRAENDQITPNATSADLVRDALPTPPEDHLLPLAGHFDFLAPCGDALAAVAGEICRDPPGFDRAAFHRDWNAAMAEFFKVKLPPP